MSLKTKVQTFVERLKEFKSPLEIETEVGKYSGNCLLGSGV
jgi:hypothetical protein